MKSGSLKFCLLVFITIMLTSVRALPQDSLNQICELIITAPFSNIELFDDSNDKFFYFKKIISNIIDSVVPIKTIRVKNKHLPWFDQELRDAIKFRDEQFVLMKTFSIDKNDPVWNEWRIIRNECKSLQRKKMCKYFSQKINEYKGDSKKYWTFYKLIVKMKKSKDISSISSILDPEKTLQTEKHIIANTFNKFFANLTCDLPDSQISKIDDNFSKYSL